MADYEPHTGYAHEMMQKELAKELSQYGEVKIDNTEEGLVYEVYQGKELYGTVHYRPESSPVVEAEGELLEKVREYFIDEFEKNHKKHEDDFKSQAK